MPTQNRTYRLAALYSLHPKPYTLKNFTFSAKERDTETGLRVTSLRSVSSLWLGNWRTSSHCTRSLRRFGSRYYSSDLSIWLSVDPQVSKYPDLSPFTYCANNPVKLVDPNGEEILICGVVYVPGTVCTKNASAEVKAAWNELNKIYETEAGRDVINELSGDNTIKYNITNDKGKYAVGGDCEKNGNNVNLHLNRQIGNSKYLSHELFHGYQYKKGQGGLSCHNEVEAQLFSFLVCGKQDLAPHTGGKSTKYGQSYINLINGDFSNFDKDFSNLRQGFLQYSFANKPEPGPKTGLYSRLKPPLGEGNVFFLKKYFQK